MFVFLMVGVGMSQRGNKAWGCHLCGVVTPMGLIGKSEVTFALCFKLLTLLAVWLSTQITSAAGALKKAYT